MPIAKLVAAPAFCTYRMSSPPQKKEKFLDRLADENGVAIVVVDAENNDVSVSNNNSMCRCLYGSKEFAPACDRYCGRAYEWAAAAGNPVDYECHAGLSCRAVPVSEGGKQFVAIVGRTCLKAERYREATEKAITGEWRHVRPTEFFENVLISGSAEGIDRAANRLEKFADRKRDDILELDKPTAAKAAPAAKTVELAAEPEVKRAVEPNDKVEAITDNVRVEPEAAPSSDVQPDRTAAAEWRSLFGSLMT